MPSSARCAAGRSEGDLIARWPAVRPFIGVGVACTVTGGLVAAVTRPTGFELGSWVAAYLVLVGGVAQIGLGVGQAWLAQEPPARREVRAEVVTWNLSIVATVVGTLVASPIVTTVGGVVLVVALGRFFAGVRTAGAASRTARTVYRGFAAILLVSTPVGLTLAWIRHA